jgi:hypothetical protein
MISRTGRSAIGALDINEALRIPITTPIFVTDLRAATNFLNQINPIPPVQPHFQKYSPSHQTQIKSITPPSRPERGALAIVTNVGMGCGGRGSVGRAG